MWFAFIIYNKDSHLERACGYGQTTNGNEFVLLLNKG